VRTVFRARLAALDSALVEISGQVRRAVSAATNAALTADLPAAEAVISEVSGIEERASDLAEEAVHLVAQQQPVAKDLRALLAVGRVAGSLQRIARLAAQVAAAARRAYPDRLAPDEVSGVLADMGALADRMLAAAGEALAADDVSAADRLQEMDRDMDRLHQEMLTIVRSRAWGHPVNAAVALTLVSRDYERIADHAVEVAAAVVYVVTAVPPPTHMH
jgi:phosphate transport system protein